MLRLLTLWLLWLIRPLITICFNPVSHIWSLYQKKAFSVLWVAISYYTDTPLQLKPNLHLVFLSLLQKFYLNGSYPGSLLQTLSIAIPKAMWTREILFYLCYHLSFQFVVWLIYKTTYHVYLYSYLPRIVSCVLVKLFFCHFSDTPVISCSTSFTSNVLFCCIALVCVSVFSLYMSSLVAT